MKVKRLFVRAGTISNDGQKLVLVMPQEYVENAPKLPLTLVFPFDSGAVGHFDDFELGAMAEGVGSRIVRQIEEAERAGMRVEGVQLDMDCPTRLLPRYADFVREMRAKQPRLKSTQFSTTALFSWLGTDGVQKLSRELDFIVPQAYEGETGRTLGTARPVSDLALFDQLHRAEGLECPYYVGLPAYGRATLYDRDGKLVNIYRGMTPQDALRNEAFEVSRAEPVDSQGKAIKKEIDWSGEQFLALKAIRSDSAGRGLGYSILYSIPSCEQLKRSLAAARDKAGHNCRGFIVFRYPEAEEALSLPLEALADTLSGKPLVPVIEGKLESTADVYGALETGGPIATREFYVRIKNSGAASTLIAPDAVTVDVSGPAGSFHDAVSRDALTMKTGVKSESGEFVETPLNTATTIRFTLPGLAAGESAEIGPIRVPQNAASHIKMMWMTRTSSSLKTLTGTG